MIKHVVCIMLFLWLCVATSVHAEEICEVDRPSIVEAYRQPVISFGFYNMAVGY